MSPAARRGGLSEGRPSFFLLECLICQWIIPVEEQPVLPSKPEGPDFQKGWDAAILAVSQWHASKAKRALVLARRARFPKSLEAEAALHERCAEDVKLLSPDDV